jgi:2-phospho-L-lactate guanylyltransferase
MPIHAVIPVKPLHDSKRRLAHLLSAAERADLIHSFLDKLLAVLNETPGIDRVLVVSGDRSVLALAEKYGAAVLVEAEPLGLNAAVARGVAHAAEAGATAVLILPADLPFARVEDIELMLRPLTADRRPQTTDHRPQTTDHRLLLAITGDEAEEGTNALLLAPPGDFTFHYGPGSFQAHLAEAQARRRATYVINAPGLRFDLDTESDWLVYNGYLVQVVDE